MSVPKLRFKEFDGDWKVSSFGKLASHISYGLTVRPEYIEDGIKLISAREIASGEIDLFNAPKISIDDFEELSDKAKPKKNDLFLSKTGSIGFTAIVDTDEEFAITQNIAVIRLNDVEKQIPLFHLHQMRTSSFQRKAISVVNQSTIMDLQLGDIKALEVSHCNAKEQTKIASFLSAVDEKISQLTQKHELLSQYKQGMMQKLFSQQVRFKADDGSEFGEWETTTLGQIAKNISAGATPSTLKEEYWGGHIKWMSSGELNYKHVYDVEKTITELGFKSSSTKLLPKHCVLIGLAGQGKTRGTVAINYIELCTNQSIAAIHPNPKAFDYRFIFFNLDMRYQELRGLSTGDGGRGGLNLQIIRGIELELPCLEEQTKIANFLSSIDQKIEVVAQQIEQAKLWKKGLLQQMFV